MLLRRSLMLLALVVASRSVVCAELGSPGEPLSLQIHGFVSQGFILSTGNNYLDDTKDGSFEFSEVGLNFTMPLTDQLQTFLHR